MSTTKLVLITGSDKKYINKIKPYLDSINTNSNFDLNFLVYLGDDVIETCDNVKVLKMQPNKYLYKNSINCLQHGEFIKSDGFDDLIMEDDVIVFTDGDMILQRNLSEDELMKFRNLKHGDVFIGYNESPNDDLLKEYNRLLPTGYKPMIFKTNLSKIKCYNSGVISATKSTFKKILHHYSELYGEIDKMMGYYAKQQWLISYIIGTENFNVIEMGYDIHNHTHFKKAEGSEINNKIVTYNDKVVLFKHKWDF
jgi:hypothetical protein